MSDLPSPAEAGFAKAGQPHAQRETTSRRMRLNPRRPTLVGCAEPAKQPYAWADRAGGDAEREADPRRENDR
jgi:hypothetical protein